MNPTRLATICTRIAALSLAAFATLTLLGSVDSLATSEHAVAAQLARQAAQQQQHQVVRAATPAPRI